MTQDFAVSNNDREKVTVKRNKHDTDAHKALNNETTSDKETTSDQETHKRQSTHATKNTQATQNKVHYCFSLVFKHTRHMSAGWYNNRYTEVQLQR